MSKKNKQPENDPIPISAEYHGRLQQEVAQFNTQIQLIATESEDISERMYANEIGVDDAHHRLASLNAKRMSLVEHRDQYLARIDTVSSGLAYEALQNTNEQ